jgi:hypothetical protein
MHLDKSYDPTSNFYDCNPRSIFEKGIYYALSEANVPCGKSDPLNVAKNAQKIDMSWALGKRPESAAIAAAKYISFLWDCRGTQRHQDLVSLFFKRLHDYAIFVDSQNVEFVQVAGRFNGVQVAHKLARFTIECAEGGAIPQFIIGLLLRYLREDNVRYQSLLGIEESVFGTNTTSKKPADVWEVNSDGSIGKLYEITVKAVDTKRLDDCVDSLLFQRIADKEVIFICNLPGNAASLVLTNGALAHRGVQFQFVDIKEFLISTFVLLDSNAQLKYVAELQRYIFLSTRAVATKKYWADNFVIS